MKPYWKSWYNFYSIFKICTRVKLNKTFKWFTSIMSLKRFLKYFATLLWRLRKNNEGISLYKLLHFPHTHNQPWFHSSVSQLFICYHKLKWRKRQMPMICLYTVQYIKSTIDLNTGTPNLHKIKGDRNYYSSLFGWLCKQLCLSTQPPFTSIYCTV